MSDRPKILTLVNRTTSQISEGSLRPGDRLPSIRQAAATLGLAKNTVAEAYLRLVSLGLLESRAGSGFRVAQRATARPDVSPKNAIVEAVDLVSLLREQLDRHYDVRPGDARPPIQWLQGLDFQRRRGRGGARHRERIEEDSLSQWGYRPLRERLALSLGDRGIVATPDQVLLTNGANHALDLIIRHFVQAGDTVLVDDPGYYPLFGKLRLAGATAIGVRRGANGPDLEALAAAAAHRPTFFFTQSLAHNPTGGSVSLGGAYGVLQLAERHDFRVVETDPFADVLPATDPRLAALDQLKRVIYVGTFSKTLSASLRVGFLAAATADAAALADLKMVTITATSDYPERIVCDLLISGQYLRHLRRLRDRLDRAHDEARAQYNQFGITLAEGAGLYLWVPLPQGVDELELIRRASAESIFMAPGRVFAAGKEEPPPATRVNVAHASHPRFLDFLKRHAFAR